MLLFFFFQAEDGIRDIGVTGVQTCALPILKAFRERGFRFAVDDAGSGYAGLGSIANLEPDFIKLDMSLINCIDANFIKQNLVETMVRFANDQGAKVIAEGVERAEEFETVRGDRKSVV